MIRTNISDKLRDIVAAIDLKTAWKDGRFIRSIELHYHSRLNFRGEAIVEVWAQED